LLSRSPPSIVKPRPEGAGQEERGRSDSLYSKPWKLAKERVRREEKERKKKNALIEGALYVRIVPGRKSRMTF